MDESEKALKLQETLQKFIDSVDEKRNAEDPGGNGLTAEFRVLRELGMKMRDENTHPCEAGKKSYNIRKNRFKDILPFDETRVTLEEIPGEEGSDYINANFILDIYGNNGYIASQGPVRATVSDFWRMLWEYKVRVVTMACRLVEMGKRKCEQYWPTEDEKTLELGDITVTLEEEEDLAEHCNVRKLLAEKDGQSRHITQFHYTGWPDHDIPTDFDVVLEMIAQMRKIRATDPLKAPMVVHCSAGCGRTGTICAIDYAWDSLKMGKVDESFCLYDIIKDLRDQRQSMIQTPEQYEFAHITVQKLFQKHLGMMEDHIYGNVQIGELEDEENIHIPGGRKDSVLEDDINQTISQLYSTVYPTSVGKLPEPLVPEKLTSPSQLPEPLVPEKVVSPTLKERVQIFSVEKIENIPKTSEKKRSPERPKIEAKKPSLKEGTHTVLVNQKSLDQHFGSLKSQGSLKGEAPTFDGKKSSFKSNSHSVVDNKENLQNRQIASRENSIKSSGSIKENEIPDQNFGRRQSSQVEGKHVTVLSVGGPGKKPIISTKSVPAPSPQKEQGLDQGMARAKTLPANTIVTSGGAINKGQTVNSNSNSNAGFYTYAQANPAGTGNQPGSFGSSSFYSAVSDQSGDTTNVTPQTGMTYSVVNKETSKPGLNLYSSVEKSNFSHSSQSAADGTYDVVQFNGADEAPVIPDRGYLEPEPTSHEPEKVPEDTTVKRKNQLMSGLKTLFSGKQAAGGGMADSSDIPGYKIKIGKQPRGPRNPPASWSKN